MDDKLKKEMEREQSTGYISCEFWDAFGRGLCRLYVLSLIVAIFIIWVITGLIDKYGCG